MNDEYLRIIAALETLLTDYTRGHSQMGDGKLCILCTTVGEITADTFHSSCSRCPWTIQTGKKCTDKFFEIMKVKKYNKYLPEWILYRMEQIPIWIQAYKDNLV